MAGEIREPFELSVRRACQGASGGSYLVRYRARVELTADRGVAVTIASLYPNSDETHVELARDAIRKGFEQALELRRSGALVTVDELTLHPVDFSAKMFTKWTAHFVEEFLADAGEPL